ncbi:acyl-ACP--UDP-N-acetylglucosamine O-acyltransferase [Bdellovibrionota bacterium FG-1]
MIHPTAFVDKKAELDSSVEVGPFCTIGPHVRIGKGTRLVSHVVLDGWTEIGPDNTIFPFAVLGAVPQDLKYRGEPTQLVIGSRNVIRESVTMNLGTVGGGGLTKLGDDNLIMAYTHFGHDCIVGNHCIVANYAGLAGHVILGDYVTIAGQVGISPFVNIGDHAYVTGQTGVEKDVTPFTIVMGQRPASVKGCNIVGLRRRGYSAEIIQKINESIKLWQRPDVQKEQCLLEIESQYGEYKEIHQFVSFIRKSEIGVTR